MKNYGRPNFDPGATIEPRFDRFWVYCLLPVVPIMIGLGIWILWFAARRDTLGGSVCLGFGLLMSVMLFAMYRLSLVPLVRIAPESLSIPTLGVDAIRWRDVRFAEVVRPLLGHGHTFYLGITLHPEACERHRQPSFFKGFGFLVNAASLSRHTFMVNFSQSTIPVDWIAEEINIRARMSNSTEVQEQLVESVEHH